METVIIICDVCGKEISTKTNHFKNEFVNMIKINNEVLLHDCCDECVDKIKKEIKKLRNENIKD